MRLRWVTAALVLAFSALSGCAVIRSQLLDCCDDVSIRSSNRALANRAWCAVWPHYENVPCIKDFELGFKSGYCDIAGGGRGCTPALPPRCYWKSKYRGVEGKTRTQAWFDGFRHGVIVAEQDGVYHLSRIPTSIPPVAPLPDAAISQGVAPRPRVEEINAPREPLTAPPAGIPAAAQTDATVFTKELTEEEATERLPAPNPPVQVPTSKGVGE